MMKVYGLKNCDTCRKVLKKFDADDVAYSFIDFNKDGVGQDTLSAWLEIADMNTFINRRSTTWRMLDDDTKAKLEAKDVAVFMEHTSVIKRPVFYLNNKVINGFNDVIYEGILKS